ncbi:MAG: sulfite exporter TauE/SafE family protein [Clostridium sp.]
MAVVIVCIIAGLLAGAGVGLVGISSATVITPMLIVILKMNAYKAIGVALTADVLAAGVSSYTYFKHKNIDIKNGIVIMITTMIFTLLSSFLSKYIPNEALGGFSIITTGLLGLRFLFKPVKGKEDSKAEEISKEKKFIKAVLSGALIGVICGVIGAGGGLMLLLMLTSVLGYDLKTAIGTSTFIMAFTALTGGVAHIAHGGTNIEVLVICSVCALISSKILAKIANKIDDKLLNKVTGIFLICFAVILIIIKFM